MNNSKKFYKKAAALLCGGMLLFMCGQVIGSEEEYDEDTYGPEAPVVWEEPGSGSTFSHKVHTLGLGLECDSCHDELFQMEAGVALEATDFNMAGLNEGKYCGACHDGDSAFATTEECASCHGEPAKKQIVFTKPVKAVIFDHGLHTEMGIDCGSCHGDLFKMKIGNAESHPEKFTMQALYDGKYCGACHDGEQAFASNTRCTICHIGVKGFDRMHGAPKAAGGGH